MSYLNLIWSWLIHATLFSAVILLIGFLAVRFLHQPVHRLRLIQWTFLGCLIVPVLGFCSTWKIFSLGLIEPLQTPAPISQPTPIVFTETIPVTLPSEAPEIPQPVFIPEDRDVSQTPESITATDNLSSEEPTLSNPALPSLTWDIQWLKRGLIGCYFCGLFWITMRLLKGSFRLHRLKTTASPASSELQLFFNNLTNKQSEKVQLLVTDQLDVPITWGLFKPVILLPQRFVSGENQEKLHWSLAHEWSHVERRDVATLLLANVVQFICFYQPCYWWLRRQLILCQDFLADARATRQTDSSDEYAQFLVALVKERMSPGLPALGIIERKSPLFERVKMLLESEGSLLSRCRRPVSVLVALGALVLFGGLSTLQLGANGESEWPSLEELINTFGRHEQNYLPYHLKSLETFHTNEGLTEEERRLYPWADGRNHQRKKDEGQFDLDVWMTKETVVIDEQAEQQHEQYNAPDQQVSFSDTQNFVHINKEENRFRILFNTELAGLFPLSVFGDGNLLTESIHSEAISPALTWDGKDAVLEFIRPWSKYKQKFRLWLSHAHNWHPIKLQRYLTESSKHPFSEWKAELKQQADGTWRVSNGIMSYSDFDTADADSSKFHYSVKFQVEQAEYGNSVSKELFTPKIPEGYQIYNSEIVKLEQPIGELRELSVEVVDLDDKPISGAKVWFGTTDRQEHDVVETNLEGVAKTEKAPDKASVKVTAEQYRPTSLITLNNHKARMRLAPHTTGTTIDEEGVAIPDVWITTGGLNFRADGMPPNPRSLVGEMFHEHWSNEKGRFILQSDFSVPRELDQPISLIALDDSASRMALKFITASELKTPQELVLKPVCKITGEIEYKENFNPSDFSPVVEDFQGRFIANVTPIINKHSSKTTLEFKLRLPEGDYRLRNRKGENEPQFSIPLSIEKGQRELNFTEADTAKIQKNSQNIPESTPGPTPTKAVTATEFLINDQQGNPIPSGTIWLRGFTDKDQFFEQEYPFEKGQFKNDFGSNQLRELRVKVSAPNYQTFLMEYDPKGINRYFPVERSYTYALAKAITIGGTLVDENGSPLEGVKVYCSLGARERKEGGRDSGGGWYKTDSRGKWAVDNIRPDFDKLYLRLEHPTHEYATDDPSFSFKVPEKEFLGLKNQTDVRTLKRAPQLTGIIVDPDGNPVPGVMILQHNRRNFYQDYSRNIIPESDDNGQFQLSGLKEGKETFTFFSKDWAMKTLQIDIPHQELLRISLNKGRRVEFRAINEPGQPIAGIKFHPEASRLKPIVKYPEHNYLRVLDFLSHRYLIGNKTDANGLFVWENAPAEILHYQITGKEYLSQPQGSDYSPEDSPVTITFRKIIPVIGTVVDNETGKPIDEFRLYQGTHFKANRPRLWSWNQETSRKLRPVNGSWAEGSVGASADIPIKPGQFATALRTLDRIEKYRVQADGYFPVVSRELDAAALPDEPVYLEFRLKKNTGVKRTILTPEGIPANAANVAIKIGKKNESSLLEIKNGLPVVEGYSAASEVLRTDQKGIVNFPVINEQFVCVLTHESGYLQLKSEELYKLEKLKLKQWVKVEGMVYFDEQAATEVHVRGYHSHGHHFLFEDSGYPGVRFTQSATTDQSGKYLLTKGVPGEWTVWATTDLRVFGEQPPSVAQSTSPHWSRSESVEFVEGQSTHHDIGRSGIDVIGKISIPDLKRDDWKYLGLRFYKQYPRNEKRPKGKELYQVSLDKDGSFRIDNLSPGTYFGRLQIGQLFDGKLFINNARYPNNSAPTIKLTPEMFDGKSSDNPIDMGTIVLNPVWN